MFDGLTIDRYSGKPVSLQIAQYVRCKIADSDLLPGEKFPTTQDFGRQIGVGPHTIRQAMKHLENEGLVKSTPRLGTIVCDRAFEIVKGRQSNLAETTAENLRMFKRIGIVGLIQDIGNHRMRYCVETAEGITQECERLGIMAIVLPSTIINMSAEQIFEELVRVDCHGLIWAHNSPPADETAIDYISQHGIKVIFRRRSPGNDGRPCIDADYETAGYRTGQYFHSQGIKELLVFSHFDFNTSSEPSTYSYPTRIKPGIVRAFEHNYLEPNIEVNVHKNEDEQVSELICTKLRQTPPTKGIIFTNGYQLLNYLCHTGRPGKELLKQFKTVAISNLTINYQLRPFVSGLDLMVLVDRFTETGRLLVGNLMGMLDGYFDSATTTLVNVDFMKFEDSFYDMK